MIPPSADQVGLSVEVWIRANWDAETRTMTKLTHSENVKVFQITINHLPGEI